MKIALVHDYIKEYGGAERVLRVLSDMYPQAPIYTAFCVKNSTAEKEFRDRQIRQSWLAPLLRIWRLYSPLRFLAPVIWGSFDFLQYDLVITSSGWYITRGFKVSPKTKVICYCHTPPRWLYGYKMSVGFTKYWPVKIYALIVGHFMRMFDFNSAQEINHWIANSHNVKERIEKFYRKEASVIYPPVEVDKIMDQTAKIKNKENYYLVVSRLVGAKGLEEAVKVFGSKSMSKYRLKIVGEAHGFTDVEKRIKQLSKGNIEFLGHISDKELYKLYAKAKGFIALAKDEDFGMTAVEAQAAGTPVIAFNGGGFKESVINKKTGLLIDSIDKRTICGAVKELERIRWNRRTLQENAKRFSKERFIKEIEKLVSNVK